MVFKEKNGVLEGSEKGAFRGTQKAEQLPFVEYAPIAILFSVMAFSGLNASNFSRFLRLHFVGPETILLLFFPSALPRSRYAHIWKATQVPFWGS